jgi:hypothetical protein
MDVAYFLKERTNFIRYFYENASTPLLEIQRKINAKEDPYTPPYSEDGEPPFLTEWLKADEALDVLGRTCISMLSESLKLYFSTWEFQFWRCSACFEKHRKQFNDGGFVTGYRECFSSALGINWADCPADFAILEQIALARNADQHPTEITSIHVNHSKSAQQKFPNLFFVRDSEEAIAADAAWGTSRWWDPTLRVSKVRLFAAIGVVEELVDWLDDQLQKIESS